MPHLRFRAIEPAMVQELSTPLADQLQPLMNCPREDFTFEHIPAAFFFDGKPSTAYPFVEVLWFDRGQETQDKVALILTEQVRHVLGKDVDVAVIFTALNAASYYDNGEHY
ncbi:DUF1904 domain-containing protein [Vibrio agarivorans]|uniref:DUF1904 domain-containing protein n=1 Tax=Vibrio agarivorans TaxID=153622 RepID=UPI0035E8FBE9